MLNETPASHVLHIVRCNHLGQPVVALIPANYTPQGVAVYSHIQSRNILFVEPEFLPDGFMSLDALSERLWQAFGNAIIDGRFSFSGGSYCYYDEDDLNTIRQSQNHKLDEDD
jgi:hypothetical protein